MGNICRSPSAEAVMNAKLKAANLQDKIITDSAGIIGWHSGEPADHRMKSHAIKRGYDLTSISRQFNPEIDFDKFDYIIGMDHENMRDLRGMDPDQKYKNKIFLMTGFCQSIPAEVVPDPYYGGSSGFETVLDILDDACDGLLEHIKNNSEE
ncbi:MAG: low molecular weight phosphotyrosine protein phosphatase [Calditrichaeota bacterium]|nr:MAG: low molecular weight phosphotyrosine protein phosphatase [Calditrichota bacterium]MBL1207020.1 low molecular weight phosphotyrosine protein phosphatase [Calditrichota bacterium]NOG46847.1 low molecular weight phosphotyrosine protein phosphatase [Calditrichota bacterium]